MRCTSDQVDWSAGSIASHLGRCFPEELPLRFCGCPIVWHFGFYSALSFYAFFETVIILKYFLILIVIDVCFLRDAILMIEEVADVLFGELNLFGLGFIH